MTILRNIDYGTVLTVVHILRRLSEDIEAYSSPDTGSKLDSPLALVSPITLTTVQYYAIFVVFEITTDGYNRTTPQRQKLGQVSSSPQREAQC